MTILQNIDKNEIKLKLKGLNPFSILKFETSVSKFAFTIISKQQPTISNYYWIIKLKKLNPMIEEKNVLVAISGGRSSALMSYHIYNSPKYKDWNKIFVFANTGMERPETIDFLKNIEKHWGIEITKIEGVYSPEMGVGVHYKIVDWENLDMNAKAFENAIMHMNKGSFDGLPNSAAPYCSERMKTIPSKKIGDEIFGLNNYKTAIVFRFEDMPKRISFAEIKMDQKRIFPLLTDFESPVTQQFLNDWWSKQSFKLEIHNKFGNCELCWKKSEKNLIEVIRHGTRFVDWVDNMEQK